MTSRLEIFQEMAEQQPDDAMVWYGLASEYTKLERWSEAATALERVVTLNPDYTAAFQMLGTTLMTLGKSAEARQSWTQGIEAANRTGAWKARQHMEGLLATSDTESEPGFCQE
ncbi:MAG: tetratricopeptide repeat protein [Acidobacteria bacterium]|nr:tetratricopeptide repeat protein [Acidobacteriota bacterium]